MYVEKVKSSDHHGSVVREFDGAHVGRPRLVQAVEPTQEVGARGVIVAVPIEPGDRLDTTFASDADASSRPCTFGSALPISSNSVIQRGIDSARSRADSSLTISP